MKKATAKKITYKPKKKKEQLKVKDSQGNLYSTESLKQTLIPTDITPVVILGDVIKALKKIPEKSIDVIITSPPYYKQREYDVSGEIGQEKTVEEYINKLVEVSKELKRVLKDSGSYFLNIGDKYSNKNQQLIPFRLAIAMQSNGWLVRNVIVWHKHPNPMPTSIKDRFNDIWEPVFFFVKDTGKYYNYDYYFNLDPLRIPHKTEFQIELPYYVEVNDYEENKEKFINENTNNLSNSKFLGNEKNRGASPGARSIINGTYYTKQRKHKINHELETKIIEYLREHRKKTGIGIKEIDKILNKKDTAGHWFRLDPGRSLPSPEDWKSLKNILKFDYKYDKVMTEEHYVLQVVKPHPNGKNPGNIWQIAPAKLKDSHFAVFPDELPLNILKACCPTDGIVLDPFAGSGTTGKVAMELNLKSILIELNPLYLRIIKKRCCQIEEVYLNDES